MAKRIIIKEFSQLGKAIEHYQAESAISSYRISVLTGLTESTLSRLKYGETNPSFDTLERIANVLNVNLSDIILKYESFK